MGPERIEKGLTAFEDGASSWGECFFARAYQGECNLQTGFPERILMKKLGLRTRVQIRNVYYTFDGLSTLMSKGDLRKFIEDVLDESRPEEVMALLRQVNYHGAEQEVKMKPGYICEELLLLDANAPGDRYWIPVDKLHRFLELGSTDSLKELQESRQTLSQLARAYDDIVRTQATMRNYSGLTRG